VGLVKANAEVSGDFGLVHPGPFLRGDFPFGVAVFPRRPARITLRTIQTAIGDHINSSVARDHGLIGHGCFICESIQGVWLPVWKSLPKTAFPRDF
jgi:hypothetical protein